METRDAHSHRVRSIWIATLEDGAVCYELLVAIPNNINGGRNEMSWLRYTFLEPDDDSTELERLRYARASILKIIGGYLMSDLSRNLVHLRWLLKLVNFRAAGEFSWGSAVLGILYREMWNHSVGYVGLPTSFEDIRLLLDQRSEVQFQWTPYEDLTIRAVIQDEYL
ncbi:hypothetical protein Gotur_005849 [Gossypium turneri]